MPRENKKRGRRALDQKRKLEDDANDDGPDAKRVKSSDDQEFIPLAEPSNGPYEDESAEPNVAPFYGLLDEDEQEYFKHADDLLELNQFSTLDERELFLETVYREASGKELKIASSQSCSRLLERLILISKPGQLKLLFQKFDGHFLHLVQHRFASHCCEALFIAAAPVVTQELSVPPKHGKAPAESTDALPSMENFFLGTLDELEGNLGYLMTDKFASHALRILLVVLSGEPLAEKSSVVKSKRKESISVNGLTSRITMKLEKRTVPESFSFAIEKIISDTVLDLDINYLRVLATHQTGNPTLQLLLRLELTTLGKQRAKNDGSLIRKLLPDETISDGTESASFINGLLYDPVGSRLLETIVEFAPGKIFKTLYKELFRDRLPTLARNEIAGYVVCKVLERLGADDLREARKTLVPSVEDLVERNRLAIIKTLIERCHVRGVDTSEIAAHIESAYTGLNGFDIAKLLHLESLSPVDGGKEKQLAEIPPERIYGSLLAQSMVTVPGPLSDLIFDALVRADGSCFHLAKDPSASHTLQAAIKSPHASIIFRRKIIQSFYGNVGEMALDSAASHVIDAIWDGTHGLAFIRERIAEELAENETSLRESHVGRAVWRNWKMDLYKRKRADWVRHSRNAAGNDGFQSFPDGEDGKRGNSAQPSPAKSKIQLARERHAASKAQKQKLGKHHRTKSKQSSSERDTHGPIDEQGS
ncbi:MAG: Nucleolar protein 9 [Bogoriella megaspora]|nr:MAG: Nucleolar protein 9 [Bogoriella megaspora]